jgi:hypothetical protein
MRTVIRLAVAVTAAVAIGAAFGQLEASGPTHEMYVHNHTGHEVQVFLFQDAQVHLDSEGGKEIGKMKDGDMLTAKVSKCTFSIVLIDKEDVWHAEFRNCDSTDVTFSEDTGHAQRQRKATGDTQ